jgi:hypothetical protein
MANKVYVARGTPVVWSDTAGDLVMLLNNLAATTGVRVGAQKDWGAGSTSEWYEWRLTVQFETAPVVGETVNVYLSTSDGTEEDGQVGVADAAGAVNDLPNMNFIGALVVTSTDADHDMTASGICRIATRYVCPVIHNKTADNLQATNDTGEFTLTPIPPELQ